MLGSERNSTPSQNGFRICAQTTQQPVSFKAPVITPEGYSNPE